MTFCHFLNAFIHTQMKQAAIVFTITACSSSPGLLERFCLQLHHGFGTCAHFNKQRRNIGYNSFEEETSCHQFSFIELLVFYILREFFFRYLGHFCHMKPSATIPNILKYSLEAAPASSGFAIPFSPNKAVPCCNLANAFASGIT